MAELANGFSFDLTNALTRDAKFPSDFFKSPGAVII
jgi:hypothetical protein